MGLRIYTLGPFRVHYTDTPIPDSALYHYHAGDQALALRAYEECRKALAEELGVEPLPETTALYEQVLGREVPASRRDIPNNLPPELTSFVGREAELAEIAKCLESPACRLLTLVGPGGEVIISLSCCLWSLLWAFLRG